MTMLFPKFFFASIDDLSAAIAEADAQDEEKARLTIRGLLDEPFQSVHDYTLEDFYVDTVKNQQFTGQVIHDRKFVRYDSLVTQSRWMDGRAWREAEPFVI